MPSRNAFLIVLTVIGLCILAVLGYSYIARTSLNGTWLLESNGQRKRMPDEMRVRIIDGSFEVTSLLPWPLPSGYDLEIDSVKLDGKERPFSGTLLFSGPVNPWQASAYSAHLENNSLSVREHFTGTPEFFDDQQWSLRNGGRQLVIKHANEEVVYDRAPLTRSLYTNRP